VNDIASTPSKTRRWTAIPAARSSAPVLKIRLWLVLGSLVLAAALGAFGGIAWLTSKPAEPAEPPPVPQAVGFAGEVANAWVQGRPVGVPVAVGVSPSVVEGVRDGKPLEGAGPLVWDSFELLQPEPGRLIEVHRFFLGGNPPRALQVTVELTGSGPVLAAGPSLVPVALSGEVVERLDYRNADGPSVTDDVESVATKWAEAFAGDDRDRLRELTGDSEPRVYAGLGGFSASDVQVVAAVPSPTSPGSWVIRVEGRLDGPEGFSGVVEWDLLVSGPETANPRVVAWGAAGTGLYLTAFENGVAGEAAPTTTSRQAVPADDAPPSVPGG
jgi:hypothetical protein